jgi:hypothetical protein
VASKGAHIAFTWWELYCEGPRAEAGRAILQAVWRGTEAPGCLIDEDLVGNWLLRPDGTRSPAWDYFHELFQSQRPD